MTTTMDPRANLPPGGDGEPDDRIDPAPRARIAAVDEHAQSRLRRSVSQDVWLGVASHRREDLEALAGRLAEAGYGTAFAIADYRKLDEQAWNDGLAACDAASGGRVLVMPGYELLDDEGVRTAVLGPAQQPRHELKYADPVPLRAACRPPFGGATIVRDVLRNRIPLQRFGGSNLVEWDPAPAWSALYRQMVALKSCFSPVYFSRSAEDAIARTCVLVPLGAKAFDVMRGSRHATYVSSGPRIESFGLFGPGLVDDEAEGYWYGYQPGEDVELTVSLLAKSELDQVVIWDGTEKFAAFNPGERRFARCIKLRAWRDHAFHLTASDADGGVLHASFPVYTRNVRFWGHMGADRMDYCISPMRPRDGGPVQAGRARLEPCGSVTLGAARGDRVHVTTAVDMSGARVQGAGSPAAHHPSAVLTVKHQVVRLNDHRRVCSFCGADAQVFRSEIAGQCLRNEKQLAQTWHGRLVVPTRIFLPAPGAACSDDYIVWRWGHGEPACVEIWKHFSLDPRYLEREWITFATNSHDVLPRLIVRSVRDPAHRITVADLPVVDVEDRTGVAVEELTRFEAAGGDVEVGDGSAGTFGLFPLGLPRGYRCLLAREPDALRMFFQCRPTDEERSAATFTVHYLVAACATDVEASSFGGGLLNRIERLSGDGKRQFSVGIHVGGRGLPVEVDVDERCPALEGQRACIRVSGLPDRMADWADSGGRTIFSSQAVRGRSYHIIEPDMPRAYTLRTSE